MAGVLCIGAPACTTVQSEHIGAVSAPAIEASAQAQAPQLGTAPIAEAEVRVEYARVEGQRCLQPIITGGVPDSGDFVVAEKQWLAKSYPGYSLSSSMLFLGTQGQPNLDRIDFTTADGETMSVCFALGTSPAVNKK